MFAKFSNSWNLVKASAKVLQSDKELLIFPIISAIGTIIVSLTFALPLLLSRLGDSLFGQNVQVLGLIVLFLFYVIQYVVIFFANTALVGAAIIRIKGGDPTVSDGFRIAASHFGAILGYALIAATVGMLLKAFSKSKSNVARIVISMLGFAWNIATFLVVPILAVEGIGPIQAIKRSVQLLKKTWGEQIIGNFGLGAVFGLITFLTILLGIACFLAAALWIQSIAAAIAVAVIFILLLVFIGLINSALSGIYTAAVYQYAATGQTSGFFESQMVSNAFVTK